MEVKGKFKLETQEVMKFSSFHQRKNVLISYAVIYFFSLGINYLTVREINGYLFLISAVSGLVFSILLSLLLHIRNKSVYRSYTLVNIATENTFDGEGIRLALESNVTEIPYDKIHKVCETKTAFYVYISNIQAAVLPKKSFETPEDIAIVKLLFIQNIDKAKLKLR